MPDYYSGPSTDPYQPAPYPPSYEPRPRPWYRRPWGRALLVATTLVILVLAMASAIVYQVWSDSTGEPQLVLTPSAPATDVAAKSERRRQIEKLDRPLFGNEQARVVVVEFSDFQCPYCTQEFPVVRAMMNKYQDDILFIYRHFPIEGESSIAIAQATMCAHEQGKFWAMHDRLFVNHDELIIDSPTVVRQAALQSGVAMPSFDECLRNGTFAAAVNEDAIDGAALGVRGTPTFFVNGNIIEGVVSAEQWDTIITRALELTRGN